jgi:hypothetical protein
VNRRTKVLAIVVIAVLAAFLGDRLFTSLWWAPWQETSAKIRETDASIAKLKFTLQKEDQVSRDWDKIKKVLDKQRTPDIENHFVSHLGAICDKLSLDNNMQGTSVVRRGDFKEYVVDTKLKLTWNQYVDLLGELNNSRELLKPIKITLNSQYDKEDRIDADLRLSTIEFERVVPKAGTK